MSLSVVGADYANKRGPTRRFEIAMCIPGEPTELRPEPGNPADPQAVAVYSARGIQIGYLTAERAPWIGSMIRNGREMAAIFQAPTPYGALVRLAFDGDRPELPPAHEPVQEVDWDGVDPVYDEN
ncbi:HIRAN domain-containing protein [Sphingomonas sp. ABOLE]|uniref:HIRAN domain-containing protein n=1 Tax=Sphingomonas sp. ABOLE TaxID=1985878 RepID=UPI0013E03D21|nr:HIRAN domain-containing protein [Sphingomonas sp. ABOLE]